MATSSDSMTTTATNKQNLLYSDTNYPPIISFISKFSSELGFGFLTFSEFEESVGDGSKVHPLISTLITRLLRKIYKSTPTDKWEKTLVRFANYYDNRDGKEIEKLGFRKTKLTTKLKIIKNLLESQFDWNGKFKSELNNKTSDELRDSVIGVDRLGRSYHFYSDCCGGLRLFRSDQDRETIALIAGSRSEVQSVIEQLKSGSVEQEEIEEELLEPLDSTSNSSSSSPPTQTEQSKTASQLATLPPDVSAASTMEEIASKSNQIEPQPLDVSTQPTTLIPSGNLQPQNGSASCPPLDVATTSTNQTPPIKSEQIDLDGAGVAESLLPDEPTKTTRVDAQTRTELSAQGCGGAGPPFECKEKSDTCKSGPPCTNIELGCKIKDLVEIKIEPPCTNIELGCKMKSLDEIKIEPPCTKSEPPYSESDPLGLPLTLDKISAEPPCKPEEIDDQCTPTKSERDCRNELSCKSDEPPCKGEQDVEGIETPPPCTRESGRKSASEKSPKTFPEPPCKREQGVEDCEPPCTKNNQPPPPSTSTLVQYSDSEEEEIDLSAAPCTSLVSSGPPCNTSEEEKKVLLPAPPCKSESELHTAPPCSPERSISFTITGMGEGAENEAGRGRPRGGGARKVGGGAGGGVSKSPSANGRDGTPNSDISAPPARSSGRIAKLREKELQDRRLEEERRLEEMKVRMEKSVKGKSTNSSTLSGKHDSFSYKPDMSASSPSPSSGGDDDELDCPGRRRKNKKKSRSGRGRGQGRPGRPGPHGNNVNKQPLPSTNQKPWLNSTDESEAPSDEHVEEEEEEEPNQTDQSDHEFSMEEEEEGEEIRRVRTARADPLAEFDPSDPFSLTLCTRCNLGDHPEWILLCDGCDCGTHASCCKPVIFVIPEGEWFCERCSESSLIKSLSTKLVNFDTNLPDPEDLQKIRFDFMEIAQKRRSAQVAHAHAQRTHGDFSTDSGASSKSDQPDFDSSSEEEDSKNLSQSQPLYKLRTRGSATNRFDLTKYDEMMEDALADDENVLAEIRPGVRAPSDGAGDGDDLDCAGASADRDACASDSSDSDSDVKTKIPKPAHACAPQLPTKKPRRKLNDLNDWSDVDGGSDFETNIHSSESNSGTGDSSPSSDGTPESEYEIKKPLRVSTRKRRRRRVQRIVYDDSDEEENSGKSGASGASGSLASASDWSEGSDSDEKRKRRKAPAHAWKAKAPRAPPSGKKTNRRKRKKPAESPDRSWRASTARNPNDSTVRTTRGKKINFKRILEEEEESEEEEVVVAKKLRISSSSSSSSPSDEDSSLPPVPAPPYPPLAKKAKISAPSGGETSPGGPPVLKEEVSGPPSEKEEPIEPPCAGSPVHVAPPSVGSSSAPPYPPNPVHIIAPPYPILAVKSTPAPPSGGNGNSKLRIAHVPRFPGSSARIRLHMEEPSFPPIGGRARNPSLPIGQLTNPPISHSPEPIRFDLYRAGGAQMPQLAHAQMQAQTPNLAHAHAQMPTMPPLAHAPFEQPVERFPWLRRANGSPAQFQPYDPVLFPSEPISALPPAPPSSPPPAPLLHAPPKDPPTSGEFTGLVSYFNFSQRDEEDI